MSTLTTGASAFQNFRNAQSIQLTINGPLNIQSAPLKRSLTPQERAEIQMAQQKSRPARNENYGTPLIDMMSSPKSAGLKTFVGSFIIGSLLTGVLALPLLAEKRLPGLPILFGATGSVIMFLFSALAGRIAYNDRKVQNANLEHLLTRLPEGATKADMMTDPLYRAEQLDKAAKQGAVDPYMAGAFGFMLGSNMGGRR